LIPRRESSRIITQQAFSHSLHPLLKFKLMGWMEDGRVPAMTRRVLQVIADAIVKLDTQIAGIEAQIMAWHKSNPMSQRLAAIPGIGPIIATAIAATVAEPGAFHGGREVAALLGLV